MKHKISITISLFILINGVLSQENNREKSTDFNVGIGTEFIVNLNYDFSLVGYQANINFPIYKKLSGNIAFSDYQKYFDYCYEVPVKMNETHTSIGLKYPLKEFNKGVITIFSGVNFIGYSYKEINKLPVDATLYHTNIAHSNTHSGFELFTDFIAGIGFEYPVYKNLTLNLNSRLSSFGDLKNSISINYIL